MCVFSLSHVPTLCDPTDYSLPGSSVHGIFQARIQKWVAISSPGDLPDPGIEHTSLTASSLAGVFFDTSSIWTVITIFNMHAPNSKGSKHVREQHCKSTILLESVL